MRPSLRSYIDGYIDRSGISVDLEIQSDFGRLAPDVELVLFRIVQEALTNISRHAYSSTASIRLWRSHKASADIVEMTIDDAGRGMPHADARALGGLRSASIRGLGLVSMRERLNQIGGRLEIESKATGTRVRAIISIVRQ